MQIHERPSPNHGSRDGQRIACLVLHSDASPTMEATIDWLGRVESGVSYHYSVDRYGRIYRHVQDSRRAWHAGKSAWRGKDDGRNSVNGFSLGVNLSNRQDGKESYPEAQLEAAAALVAHLCVQYNIATADICMHSQCATPPRRKSDPAPAGPFDFMDFLHRVQRHTAAMTPAPAA